MTAKPQTKVIKKANRGEKKSHPLYYAFANAKSVAIELARVIAADDKQNVSADVQRFIEVFGRKAT